LFGLVCRRGGRSSDEKNRELENENRSLRKMIDEIQNVLKSVPESPVASSTNSTRLHLYHENFSRFTQQFFSPNPNRCRCDGDPAEVAHADARCNGACEAAVAVPNRTSHNGWTF